MEGIADKHQKTASNISNFLQVFCISKLTQKNVDLFFNEFVRFDPLKKTQFELSFKVREDILNRGEIRLLNLDINTYSCRSQELYLLRLAAYKKIIYSRTHNPQKEKIFSILESISNMPLDLYAGADIQDDNFLFAFWLILGGVKKDGTISYAKHAGKIFDKVFSAIGIKPRFAVRSRDILNIGFDIGGKDIFYKIYYFLNKNTQQFVSEKELEKTKKISAFLGSGKRHWFFISERYKIKKSAEKSIRKKIYLEFLDDILTKDKQTLDLLAGIFKIIGCPYGAADLKKFLGALDARIAIIAFESDGTVTFYIRI